jgi:hypothetical protein
MGMHAALRFALKLLPLGPVALSLECRYFGEFSGEFLGVYSRNLQHLLHREHYGSPFLSLPVTASASNNRPFHIVDPLFRKTDGS